MNYSIYTVAKANACIERTPIHIYFHRRRCIFSPVSFALQSSFGSLRSDINDIVRFGNQHIYPVPSAPVFVCSTLSRLHFMSSYVFDINSDSDRPQMHGVHTVYTAWCTVHILRCAAANKANSIPNNGANMSPIQSREKISAPRILNVAHGATATAAAAVVATVAADSRCQFWWFRWWNATHFVCLLLGHAGVSPALKLLVSSWTAVTKMHLIAANRTWTACYGGSTKPRHTKG